MRKVKLTLLFIGLFALNVLAVDIIADISPDRSAYKAGDTAVIIISVKIPEKYHLYSNPLGPGIGKPLTLSVDSIQGLTPLAAYKQSPKKYTPQIGEWVWAYEKSAVFYVKAKIEKNGPVSGKIILDGLVCSNSCVPVTKEIDFTIKTDPSVTGKAFESAPDMATAFSKAENLDFETVSNEQPTEALIPIALSMGESVSSAQPLTESDYKWTYKPIEDRDNFNILLALLFAFIAGIILNFMPCVLPVLGIKILSFSKNTEGSRKSSILHSLSFSSGMIIVFMILASLAAWAGFSWGQQFQNPWVLTGIICVIVLFALGMFDMYMILVPSQIGNLDRKVKQGIAGDFFRGMFATVLATPCSGPFLGATLAWTLTQKPMVIYAVFFALGLGMASPYILLASSKRLRKFIPKPGAWMNDFKHVMGFFLLGFAIYMMLGLPRDMILSTVGTCLALSLAIGLFGRIAPFGSSLLRKGIAVVMTLLAVAAGLYINFGMLYATTSDKAVAKAEEQSKRKWQLFTPELLEQAQAEGKNVVIDFTATWCINCQYNKIAVLHSPTVDQLLDQKGVVALKADLTLDNPGAQSLLHNLGSRSVPFLAVFDKATPDDPIIMRDVLNKGRVIKVLEKLPE